MVARRQVNSTNARVLLRRMVETGKSPQLILEEEDLVQSSDSRGISEAVASVLNLHPEQKQSYQAGKTALLKFFVGLVMKELKGKGDPMEIESEIKRQLRS